MFYISMLSDTRMHDFIKSPQSVPFDRDVSVDMTTTVTVIVLRRVISCGYIYLNFKLSRRFLIQLTLIRLVNII